MGEFPSGQRGQTVNLLALLSKVRILPLPFCPGGGTGRRTGLKILRKLNSVPVRFRFWAFLFYAFVWCFFELPAFVESFCGGSKETRIRYVSIPIRGTFVLCFYLIFLVLPVFVGSFCDS